MADPKKGLAALIVGIKGGKASVKPGPDKEGDDDAEGDDSDGMKSRAAKKVLAAIKADDAEALSDALEAFCMECM